MKSLCMYAYFILHSTLYPKTMYANLSDEILFKRINSYIRQCKSIIASIPRDETSIDCECVIEASYKCVMEAAQLVIDQPVHFRDKLETTCIQLAEAIVQLKAEAKENAQRNFEIAQEQLNVAQRAFDDAERTLKTTCDMIRDFDVVDSPMVNSPMVNSPINGGNLESLKREFFNRQLTPESEVHTVPFGFYKGVYNYASDMDGRHEFVARNTNMYFAQKYEKYAPHVISCCKMLPGSEPSTYVYESYWLVNSITIDDAMSTSARDGTEWNDMQIEAISKDEFLAQSTRDCADENVVYIH